MLGGRGVIVVVGSVARHQPVATVGDVCHSGGRDPCIGVFGDASVDAEGVHLFKQSHREAPAVNLESQDEYSRWNIDPSTPRGWDEASRTHTRSVSWAESGREVELLVVMGDKRVRV